MTVNLSNLCYGYGIMVCYYLLLTTSTSTASDHQIYLICWLINWCVDVDIFVRWFWGQETTLQCYIVYFFWLFGCVVAHMCGAVSPQVTSPMGRPGKTSRIWKKGTL